MSDIWKLCRIGKRYEFSAAHWLPMVGLNHPCHRMHGHNYVIELEMRNEIANDGFCGNVDFFQMDRLMQPILAKLDHHTLNDVPGLENPTAELIALWILREYKIHYLFSVTVWETPDCWAQVVQADGSFPRQHRE